MDDVMDIRRIERVAPSPDGDLVAVVASRPARSGEVFGRTYYETDPSRNDVLLVSRRTGTVRDLTHGAEQAAGSWCATWSPDGRRLAFLSTRPEGGEPRGGDNVRLYVWEVGAAAPKRLGPAALMTQTHYGSPMYRLDLRGGADGRTTAHPCGDEEKAPFLWLDGRRLLALTLPVGSTSGLIDEQGRPDRSQVETIARMRTADAPTGEAVASGDARPASDGTERAVLTLLDAGTGTGRNVAELPVYPFRGETTVSVAPDGRTAAVLATASALRPVRAAPAVNAEDDSWTVQKRLGLVDLSSSAPVRWRTPPAGAGLPLELYGWSADGRRVAFRARADQDASGTTLFTADQDGAINALPMAARCLVGGPSAGQNAHEAAFLWLADGSALAQGSCGSGVVGGRSDWWLLRGGSAPLNVTTGLAQPPSGFRRGVDGRLYATGGGRLLRLDAAGGRLVPVTLAGVDRVGGVAWPVDAGIPAEALLLTAEEAGEAGTLVRIAPDGMLRAERLAGLEPEDRPVAADGRDLLVERASRKGLSVVDLGAAGRTLLAVDGHLGRVEWGATRTIAYRGTDGQNLVAKVILPPGYDARRRYPVVTWVYPGMNRGAFDYWLDPYLPGIYNLQVYAARGYVVLVPEMPLSRADDRNDMFLDMTKGAVPAVDRLIEMGIADPDRVGVMGQSMGGYAVYSLVTQTTRFRAAVAVAGPTDFAGFAQAFDATARAYPSIAHERSYNWNIATYGGHASLDQDFWNYLRESPLAYADRVRTPLLMLHGERDARAPLAQAEAFFYRLYRRGATARLVRYWGENHALARSPANVRDAFAEAMAWFDRYMPPSAGPRRPAS